MIPIKSTVGRQLDLVTMDYDAANLPVSVRRLRPVVFRDGDSFCCLLGPDSQEGLWGRGPTMEDAIQDWDANYQEREKKTRKAGPVGELPPHSELELFRKLHNLCR